MSLDAEKNFSPSGNILKCSAVVGLLIYHNEILAIVFAGKKAHIDSVKAHVGNMG